MIFFRRTTSLRSVLLIALAAGALIGCSSRSVSMGEWQRSMDAHAVEIANGDASFVRSSPISNPHQTFAVIGDASPDRSTDVYGTLLGRHLVQGTSWLIFLTATVEDRAITDIRIALRSDEPGANRWEVSEENRVMLQAYKRTKESWWRAKHPGREDPPHRPSLFPPEEDVYRVEVAGNTVSVFEQTTGARWTMVVQ